MATISIFAVACTNKFSLKGILSKFLATTTKSRKHPKDKIIIATTTIRLNL